MADIVFILGAGASRAAGGPLMSDFFDKARRLRDTGSLRLSVEDYAAVDRLRSELQKASAKASIDVYNLESLFVALEMMSIVGRPMQLDEAEASALLASLKRFVAATLDASIQHRWYADGSLARLRPAPGHDALASLIKSCIEAKPARTVAVLTFNYDIGLEFALRHEGLQYDYGLGTGVVSPEPVVRFCKLHGSLNWADRGSTSPLEEVAAPGGFADAAMLQRMGIERVPRRSQEWLERFDPKALPFIVVPTESKLEHRRRIAPIWKVAADELSGASAVVVVGYSLPPTDVFFRYFYGLGSIGPKWPEAWIVVNSDGEAIRRFRDLLSRSLESRFVPIEAGFPEARPKLVEALRIR